MAERYEQAPYSNLSKDELVKDAPVKALLDLMPLDRAQLNFKSFSDFDTLLNDSIVEMGVNPDNIDMKWVTSTFDTVYNKHADTLKQLREEEEGDVEAIVALSEKIKDEIKENLKIVR